MVVFLNGAPPGYKFEVTADLSRIETRERLSQPAMDGFFAIVEKWEIPMDVAAELLGGVPRSTLYKGKTAAGTLSLDRIDENFVTSSGSTNLSIFSGQMI
jgi:hypothetical protein